VHLTKEGKMDEYNQKIVEENKKLKIFISELLRYHEHTIEKINEELSAITEEGESRS
jgi:hypothetical protein